MTVSMLITTYNRTPLLARSLERLQDRTLPDEIVIVDDGGSDGCDDLCLDLRAHGFPTPIVYVYNHRPDPELCSQARNVGLRHTTGKFVLQTEPEILFDTDVIAQMLQQAREHPDETISAGTVHNLNENGSPGQTLIGWVATYAVLYRREWLMEIGGWDETFPDPWGWDCTDLKTRLRLSGHGDHIDPAIEVTHQWHPSWAVDQEANEAHFRAKGFDDGNLSQVVANRDREWGVLRT